jgi:hypothetical protein
MRHPLIRRGWRILAFIIDAAFIAWLLLNHGA